MSYPNVDSAQPEVKEALKRFNELPEEEQKKQVLLWWLLGEEGTPPYKMSTEDSAYTHQSEKKGQTCSNCSYFYSHVASGKFVCSVIRPYVMPQGWCRLWEDGAEYEIEDYREKTAQELLRLAKSLMSQEQQT